MMLGPEIIAISHNYWSDQSVFARQGEGTLTIMPQVALASRNAAPPNWPRVDSLGDGHDRPRRKQPPEFVMDPDWRWVPSADFAR